MTKEPSACREAFEKWIQTDDRKVADRHDLHAYTRDEWEAWKAAWQAAIRDSNAELVEALEFYSNPSDYVAPFTGGLGKLYFDCSNKAKEALARHNADKGGA